MKDGQKTTLICTAKNTPLFQTYFSAVSCFENRIVRPELCRRRAGIPLGPPTPKITSAATRKKAAQDSRRDEENSGEERGGFDEAGQGPVEGDEARTEELCFAHSAVAAGEEYSAEARADGAP